MRPAVASGGRGPTLDSPVRTANLAIVFTQLEGFAERAAQLSLEQSQRLLALQTQLLTPLIRALGGRVVKPLTDGLLATFESPTQAVLCGAAVQDRLWQHNKAAAPGEQLQLRYAANVGEVRLEDRDVFGEPVNIAARVLGMARPGEVFFSESVYLAMNKAEVPSQELGAFELKGVPGKVRIFQLPRAPFRIEPAPVGGSAEQPPFGNLGLSRVDPAQLERPDLAQLGAYAADLGGRLVHSTQQALQQVAEAGRSGDRRRLYLIGGLAALALAALVLAVAGGSAVEEALQAVREAPAAERPAAAAEARRLIAEVKDPGERAYQAGLLEEALDNRGAAIGRYAAALQGGWEDAAGRLEELLADPSCPVRARAAETLGRHKVASARGALEQLAEAGGADDTLFCDSKGAARRALQGLE